MVDAVELCEMQAEVERVHIDDSIYEFIAQLTASTRKNPHIRLGASPRGSIALVRLARAAAWLSGRDYVVPEDVDTVFYDALEHRLLLNAQAKVAGLTAHGVLEEIRRTTRPPKLV